MSFWNGFDPPERPGALPWQVQQPATALIGHVLPRWSGSQSEIALSLPPLRLRLDAALKHELPNDQTRQFHVATRIDDPPRAIDLLHGSARAFFKELAVPLAVPGRTTTHVPSSTGSLPVGRLTGPVKFMRKLMSDWHLQETEIALLLGFDEADRLHVTNILSGHSSLRGRDAKDRIVALLQMRRSLSSLFRDVSTENDWLREPQEDLDGESPLDCMLEGSMRSLFAVGNVVETMSGR